MDIDAQISEITAVLEAADKPLSRTEIVEKLSFEVSDRTLQRRLTGLVAAGTVVRFGHTVAIVYAIARQEAGTDADTDTDTDTGTGSRIHMSTEAMSVLQDIRKPILQRTPVSWHRELTEQTTHFTPAERQHLFDLGRTSTDGQRAGTHARGILDRLLIDLSWASSHLEGNTYTLLDTRNLIEFGREVEGRDAMEAQMILNHKRAIEFLVDGAEFIEFNAFTICNLHATLSDGLLTKSSYEGQIRHKIVEISGTVYRPIAVPQRLEESFHDVLSICASIDDPFEQALYIMIHIPYLQPFIDCNKRLSRLAANIPFIKANLSPLSFIDVPREDYIDAMICVYERRNVLPLKEVFLWAYERSAQTLVAIREAMAEPDRFRLRYREEIYDIVHSMVVAMEPPRNEAIRRYTPDSVDSAEREQFELLAEEELRGLRESNFARYRIRPSEFAAWRAHYPVRKTP